MAEFSDCLFQKGLVLVLQLSKTPRKENKLQKVDKIHEGDIFITKSHTIAKIALNNFFFVSECVTYEVL